MSRTSRPRVPSRSQTPGNMNQLMQQAMQIQAEMQQHREDLLTQTFEGSSGGGVVTAIVRGDGTVDRVTIDPTVLDDAEMVGDLVVAAVNQAIEALHRESPPELGSLGGLDVGGLLG